MDDKGGGDQETVTRSEPWGPLQEPLTNLIKRAQTLSGSPPQFFPGQTYVGALPEETQSFQQRLGFTDQVFGGGAAPDYASMVGANQSLLSGGPGAGLYGAVGPYAGANIASQFSGPNVNIGDPSLSQGGNQALERMLSGTPDYSGVEGAVRAYADPMLDILNEDILPSLASRGVSLNNPTGEVKEANRIIPRVMRDIGNQGALLAEQERQRALGAMERGVGVDLSRAGLGLQGDVARQGALDRYRGDALGLLGQAGGLAGQSASSMAQGIQSMPSTTQMGLTPGNILGEYGQFRRGIEEAGLQDEMSRFNYNQQAPFNMVDWLGGVLGGAGAGYGTANQVQTAPGANPLLGALGLASTIGSFIPWGGAGAGTSLNTVSGGTQLLPGGAYV